MNSTIFRFVIGLLLFFVLKSPVFADAKVTKISKKQSRIMIDESYPKGTRLCVFDDDDNKILCGKVSKSNAKGSVVSLRKGAKFKKIKVGFTVTEEEGSQSGKSNGGGASEVFMFSFSFSPQVLSPITYNLATYKNPDNGVPPDTLWANYAKQTHSFEGKELHMYSLIRTLSLSFDYLFTPTIGTGIKFRYKMATNPKPLIATNYSPLENRNNEYVETTTSHSGSGFYLNGLYRMPLSSSSTLYFSGGIDFESALVSLAAHKKDDNDVDMNLELFSAKAKMSVLSLRSDTVYTYYLGSMGIDLGLGLLVPISEMGKGFSGSYLDSDENTAQLTTDPLTDLESAIGLKKNSFGLEIFLGTRFKF